MDRNFGYGACVLLLIMAGGYALHAAIGLLNQPDDVAFLLGFALIYLITWSVIKLFVKIIRKWRNNENS